MSNDHLPTPAGDPGDALPAIPVPRERLPATHANTPLALELREEERRDDDEIDLLAYWRILVKRRWLIMSVLAGVVALTLLVTLMAQPIFRATTVLQVEQHTQQIVQVEGMTPIASGADREFLQTQYELLKSRALAERTADELALDAAALERLQAPSWLDRTLALLRPEAKPAAGKAVAGAAATEADAELRDAATFVSESLTVEPVRNSRLVKVHFDSPSPEFSARVANALADGFIATGLERRFGASSYAKTYLEEQLKIVKSRLEDSERELVAFAQKENLVTTGEGRQSLVGQNLTELNAALAAAQDQRIRAQARWRQAQAVSGAALPADMLANSIIRTLQQQRAELKGTYQQKLQTFKPDYPQMQQLSGQIRELDQQIERELAGIRASVKAEFDAASGQEALLKQQLASLRDQALDVDGRSIQYNILKREVDTNRELYDGLLQRYKEVGVAGDVRANNISVIDRAQAPLFRHKPNLMLNLAVGLLLGGMLGVLVAFLLEYLDDTLKTPEDIEQRLKLAVLGIVPKLGPKQSVALAQADPRSAFSEAYRSVRTALQFSTEQGVPKTLLVTSTGPAEGKTTTAVALARNFAQLGKRVLLVEGDLRNPSLHKVLGLRAPAGLSNLLAGGCGISEAVQTTEHERFDVILAGPLPPNPAELLSGSRLLSLLRIMGERYDQVIIDGPPVLGIADAPLLANVADGTLLVVHSGRTRIAAAQAALKRLLVARGRILGALLARYDAKAAGYAYSYESYYAYGGNAPKLTKA